MDSDSFDQYSIQRTPNAKEEILKLTTEFMIDCDTKACLVLWKGVKIPHLYVDDVTIMEPVTSMLDLRKGDHLCSLVNPALGQNRIYDSFVACISRLNLVKFYHHFIVMDDVAQITKGNIPLNMRGEQISIAEYSGTPAEAQENLKSGGLSAKMNNLALFRENPLNNYFGPHAIKGVWRLQENLDSADREQIVKKAKTFMEDFKAYRLFSANCEHAAWYLKPNSKWRSPQVPIFYWFLFHSFLVLNGMRYLYDGNFFAFHLFTTIPGIVRVLFDTMKKTMRLTENRRLYGWVCYSFLTQREVFEKSFAMFVFMFIQLRFSSVPLSFLSITSLGCWLLLLWNFYFSRWLIEVCGELVISACILVLKGIPIFLMRHFAHHQFQEKQRVQFQNFKDSLDADMFRTVFSK